MTKHEKLTAAGAVAWADTALAEILKEFAAAQPADESSAAVEVEDEQQHEGFAMPWGKHAGRCVCELPAAYISWLLAQSWLKADVRAALNDEARRRNAEIEARGRGGR